MNPGDTVACLPEASLDDAAQRRPGREPRRHICREAIAGRIALAQRRPGREPRRHRVGTARPRNATTPLNEGRGVNPGDTGGRRKGDTPWDLAQRRPGREPRRHPITPLDLPLLHTLNEGRGVNPGDTAIAMLSLLLVYHAQRRPGREPRRHNRA